ncbi:hypothetical protein RKLH11_3267 [Rhodobacteraceae bacterium KLH11]|nr:hypothetical protein RKLH11_3267 [Rhodobacteraceae bacterium KLH11]
METPLVFLLQGISAGFVWGFRFLDQFGAYRVETGWKLSSYGVSRGAI